MHWEAFLVVSKFQFPLKQMWRPQAQVSQKPSTLPSHMWALRLPPSADLLHTATLPIPTEQSGTEDA